MNPGKHKEFLQKTGVRVVSSYGRVLKDPGIGFNRRHAPSFAGMLIKFASGATGSLSTVFVTADLYRMHVFGSKGWIEMRGDTELITRGLQGQPERITLPAADKEKAELEAFADAVGEKKNFVVPAEEAINGVAVLEAIVVSAAKGKPVQIR